MQINTMGFPLGAGMQSASATGGTGLGFADALGLAIGGGQPVSLKASATPPENLNPMLARMLVVQAQLAAQDQPMPAASALPGLQQPTSMAELMATAAKLPGADALPAAAAASLALDTPLAVDVTAVYCRARNRRRPDFCSARDRHGRAGDSGHGTAFHRNRSRHLGPAAARDRPGGTN
jgi:hypothetical protein